MASELEMREAEDLIERLQAENADLRAHIAVLEAATEAVLAEAQHMSMTMRRRKIFTALADALSRRATTGDGDHG